MTVIRDDFDSTRIVGVAFAGAFLVAAAILFIQAWFFSLRQADDRSKARAPASLQKYEAEQAQKLSTYGWVDRGEKKVRIPIEAAKKQVVTQLHN